MKWSDAGQSIGRPNNWHRVAELSEIERRGRKMVRIGGRQIAIFKTADGIAACNNRCPHQGYPLIEGELHGCTLTCNWHNWKFELPGGENLYGGDRLRTYPTRIRGDEIYLDLAPPPREQAVAHRMKSLCEAFQDNAYDRLARELARLAALDADPMDALRAAIAWSHERYEFGWTHAYAGLADWLTLYDEADDAETRLLCLTEGLGHLADDAQRQPHFPFGQEQRAFDENEFAEAIEGQDESNACAMLRGALAAGQTFDDLEPALSAAALRHYNSFGHSLIYLVKAGQLIRRLGTDISLPLLLSLVRHFCYATREDLIPEFRAYAGALKDFGQPNSARMPIAQAYWKQGINAALKLTVEASRAQPETLHQTLMLGGARNMLGFDLARQDRVRVPVSANINWLDFTHALTFGEAVRLQCTKFPDQWPAGLLQMALFCGRNAAFTLTEPELERWQVDDAEQFIGHALNSVQDHGLGEYIVSVHWLKTALAVRGELRVTPDSAYRGVLCAALNRFLNSPLPRRRPRRTAHQALQFVAADGE